MQLDHATPEQLRQWESELTADYQAILAKKLNLDLTRGKPSSEQLDLSDALDGILQGNFKSADGTDTRNYGGLDGIMEARELGASILGLTAAQVMAGGSSSLTMMYQAAMTGYSFGFNGADSAWKNIPGAKFLCPVPGYDRHFSVCEQLGIELVTVAMTATGPDMDQVEAMIKADASIVGMWCVPKYSNPTGVVYSDATVQRIAALAKIANPAFRVFWDNAYAVHDLIDNPPQLANIMAACIAAGTEDSVLQFTSTSKITHAGSGVAFMGGSVNNLNAFRKVLGSSTIGPDKVNQLRHMKLLPDMTALSAHMDKHAAILKPRFEAVLSKLDQAFGGTNLGSWEKPVGGYFVSFDTRPGCAKEVVKMAAEAGVKLTPAGATFPYGKDPEDRNIRIAPSVPTIAEVNGAMDVFAICVKLASVRKQLQG